MSIDQAGHGPIPLSIRLLPLHRMGEPQKADGCRFIEGDPSGIDTVWCDAPTTGIGEPYCPMHRAKCTRRSDQPVEAGEVGAPKPQRVGTVHLESTRRPRQAVRSVA